MYQIRTYNQIASKGLNRFDPAHYRVSDDTAQPDAVLLRSQKLHDITLPESVVAIARAGAGVNNIPVNDCTERGVVVFNTPGANANAVKELVTAGLLLSSRDIHTGLNFVQSLSHIDNEADMSSLLEKEKKRFAGCELSGKTLGVVGLGAIGAIVANMALDLGMNVIGYDPAISIEAAWRLSSKVEKMDSLKSLLARADYITLHVPSIEATHHLINAEALQSFKANAKLLNFARAEIVDSNALVVALDEQQLGGYISDFPAPELLGRENVLLMPHIGASTSEAEENCAVMAANQLMDFIENGNILNSVNFPATEMVKNGGYRLTFCNSNVPKVLGTVLNILADSNNNVIDLVNKSRDSVAYNIIDVEEQPSAEIIEAISTVEGVIRVRLL